MYTFREVETFTTDDIQLNVSDNVGFIYVSSGLLISEFKKYLAGVRQF